MQLLSITIFNVFCVYYSYSTMQIIEHHSFSVNATLLTMFLCKPASMPTLEPIPGNPSPPLRESKSYLQVQSRELSQLLVKELSRNI